MDERPRGICSDITAGWFARHWRYTPCLLPTRTVASFQDPSRRAPLQSIIAEETCEDGVDLERVAEAVFSSNLLKSRSTHRSTVIEMQTIKNGQNERKASVYPENCNASAL